jgi:hypothetical protein
VQSPLWVLLKNNWLINTGYFEERIDRHAINVLDAALVEDHPDCDRDRPVFLQVLDDFPHRIARGDNIIDNDTALIGHSGKIPADRPDGVQSIWTSFGAAVPPFAWVKSQVTVSIESESSSAI